MPLTRTTSHIEKEQAEMPGGNNLEPAVVAKAAGLRYVSDTSLHTSH